MDKLNELWEEGRRILRRQDEEAEQSRAEEHARREAAFLDARKVALKLFEPVGAEVPVQPCAMPDGWNPGRQVEFYIRPFGTACGRVLVRLAGCIYGGSDVWQFGQMNNRYRFYIEQQFAAGCDETSYEVIVNDYHMTDSLPEALALCERYGAAYRQAVAASKANRNRDERMDEMAHSKTPDEELLEALEAWHRSRHHEE